MKKGRTFTKTHEKKTFKLSRKINWETNAGNKTEKNKKKTANAKSPKKCVSVKNGASSSKNVETDG
jgi:hypothetical protein